MVWLILALNAFRVMGSDAQVATRESDVPDRREFYGWLPEPACKEITAFQPAAFVAPLSARAPRRGG